MLEAYSVASRSSARAHRLRYPSPPRLSSPSSRLTLTSLEGDLLLGGGESSYLRLGGGDRLSYRRLPSPLSLGRPFRSSSSYRLRGGGLLLSSYRLRGGGGGERPSRSDRLGGGDLESEYRLRRGGERDRLRSLPPRRGEGERRRRGGDRDREEAEEESESESESLEESEDESLLSLELSLSDDSASRAACRWAMMILGAFYQRDHKSASKS